MHYQKLPPLDWTTHQRWTGEFSVGKRVCLNKIFCKRDRIRFDTKQQGRTNLLREEDNSKGFVPIACEIIFPVKLMKRTGKFGYETRGRSVKDTRIPIWMQNLETSRVRLRTYFWYWSSEYTEWYSVCSASEQLSRIISTFKIDLTCSLGRKTMDWETIGNRKGEEE